MAEFTKEQIKKIRTDAEMSIQAFANALGISWASVRAWENGTRNISDVYADKIKFFVNGKRGKQTKTITIKAGDVITIKGE